MVIIVISVILLLFSLVLLLSSRMLASMVDVRVSKDEERIQAYKNQVERVEVKTSDGLIISSWNFSQKEPQGIIIMLHGTHGMDASFLLDHGKILAKEGFEVFSMDLRAHGYSQGETIGLAYTEVRDVEALVDWIKDNKRLKDKEIILYGYSMGGATAINAAAQIKEIDKVIGISCYMSCEDTFAHWLELKRIPSLLITLQRFFTRLALFFKYKMNPVANSPKKNIAKISPRPVLLIHGCKDVEIPVNHAHSLKEIGGDNVDLLLVEDKGHEVIIDLLKGDIKGRIINFISKKNNGA